MLSSFPTPRLFCLGLGLFSVGLLLGCSTTSSTTATSTKSTAIAPTFLDRPVNGTTGSPAERDAINASNQQIYNAERADIKGATPTSTTTPYQGIP